MPIKVVALPKPEFQKWLSEAKKKFAAAPPAEKAAQVAAAADQGSGEALPAGN